MNTTRRRVAVLAATLAIGALAFGRLDPAASPSARDDDPRALRAVNGTRFVDDGPVLRIVRGETLNLRVAAGAGWSGRAADPHGRLVVADAHAHVVRRITQAGQVERVAGVEHAAGHADGDALAQARFDRPVDVAVAANGDILVLDAGGTRLRRIVEGPHDRTVVTLAEGLDAAQSIDIDAWGRTRVVDAAANVMPLDVHRLGRLPHAPTRLQALRRITPTG